MPLPAYGDRVQETFTTTGTGTISLGGAVTGYQSFSSIVADGSTSYYTATDGTNWEVGLGTYATSGNTLARTTILASSNSNAAVNWLAGTKTIWLDLPASALTALSAAAVLQRVSTVVGAVATGTTLIPFDDTIPQQTEGDQYMSLAITPKNATSILVVRAMLILSNSAAGGQNVAAALFRDTGADAIAANFITQTLTGGQNTVLLEAIISSTSTAATTIKARAGGQGAGTTTFNGSGGSRLFGGAFCSFIEITEFAS